jgi:hypothetical protein
VLVLAIVALEVPLIISLRDRVDNEVRSQARTQADILAATVDLDNRAELERVTDVAARRLRGRVIVVGPNGRLRADSDGAERIGADYGDRPEIASALADRAYQERRASETLGQQILATAVPVKTRARSSARSASPRASARSAAPRAAPRSA